MSETTKNMTSRERVYRTLAFQNADRIPFDMWVLPAAKMEYGEKLEALQTQYEPDFAAFVGPFDHGFTPEYYQVGKYVDPWGSEWSNIQAGVIGEVKKPVFADYSALEGYTAPTQRFLKEWDAQKDAIAQARNAGKFVIGGWISIFERLQYLRGTEELYCDIAMEEEEMFAMIDLVMDFLRTYVAAWLTMDVDAIPFGDDWGTQISLLISPIAWVKIFKPLYKELIDTIHAAGKKVFFHSDGYIFELYPQFIEMGVDAINSQLWCMGVEKVAEKYAGKITFWGEISRQTTLPHGTPEDVRNAAKTMIQFLHVHGGGLIGQSEINRDVPLANVEALCRAWNLEENL
ncbi:MAG: uroporphyrinogen decarboxylase family protein [Ruthenibacterium sp.]